ncbi:MAG: hypothetical protein IPP76_10545 [Moraxellaceae bacterium]|nr:hypothetical protein [Moraxellaceae bacterium]
MDYIIEFIVGWFAICVVTALVARSCGRSAFGWFLCAVVFGIIALFLVLYLPVINEEDNLNKYKE